MDITSIRKAYRFYAPFYNTIFGRIVAEGRREAVNAFPQEPGDRILEIGVGTGLSLPLYSSDVAVSGIDLSPEMLAIARKRYPSSEFPQVRELLEMDAENLEYPDDYFSGSVAMHVASVVPDPAAMMREMFRVTRPGGPVLVVNHFTSNQAFMRKFERKMTPFSKKLGFRPDFSLENFVESAGASPESVRGVNFRGFWKLLEFRSPASPKSFTNENNGNSSQLREKAEEPSL